MPCYELHVPILFSLCRLSDGFHIYYRLRPFSFYSFPNARSLAQMPTTRLHRSSLSVNTTIQFSELLLQAGVPHDLDAENVCTGRLVESI